MDPNAALAIVCDDELHPEDRFSALEGLHQWAEAGGFLPLLTKADRFILRMDSASLVGRIHGVSETVIREMAETVLDHCGRIDEGSAL